MVHLLGLSPISQWFEDAQRLWPGEARRENGFLTHADMLETSFTLFLRPSAVSSDYAAAPSNTAPMMADVLSVAGAPGWAGYVGAPRLADATRGAQAVRELTGRINKLALEILDGKDPSGIGRFTDAVKADPQQAKVDAAAAAYDAGLARKQTEWLRNRKK